MGREKAMPVLSGPSSPDQLTAILGPLLAGSGVTALTGLLLTLVILGAQFVGDGIDDAPALGRERAARSLPDARRASRG